MVAAPVDGRRRWRRTIAESGWLHRRTRGAALVHHGGGTAPARARRPYVLTIHDLQYLTYPHYFSRGKRAYLDLVVPRSVRGAAEVLVPSEYVRRTVIEHLRVDPVTGRSRRRTATSPICSQRSHRRTSCARGTTSAPDP